MMISSKVAVVMAATPVTLCVLTVVLHMPPLIQGLVVATMLIPAWNHADRVERRADEIRKEREPKA
jgi:hypothetical protein